MKKLLMPIFLMLTFNIAAQSLQKHRWQNRLLIVVDNTDDSTKRVVQFSEFEKDLNGLKERKLLLYQFTPKGYKVGLEEKEWSAITEKISRINLQKTGFTVYLIGLDGGVKMEKNEVLGLDYIFALIDGMPIRRAELRGQ